MASCAIPVVCRPVKLNGERYFDGGIADAIPVQRALDQGCERLVIILSKNRNFVRTPERHRLLYHIACRNTPATVKAIDHRHIMYRQCQEKMFQLEQEGKAFIFACNQPMNISTYTMSKEANANLYKQGMKDYLARRDALQAFLHPQE